MQAGGGGIMQAIVAVDKNWGIGKNNDLLFSLKRDMAYFKEKTMNKVVVMGSNTLLSFPGSKPLKNRVNVVLYPDGEFDGCVMAKSLEELSAVLKSYPTEDIFVVGGAMFYKTMLPYCDRVYVTKVDADGQATCFYENLDKNESWVCAEEGEAIDDGEYTIRFCVYENKNPLKF